MADDDTPLFAPSDGDLKDLGPLDARSRPADGPSTIGPYRLLRPLGEGGMGEVWLAEQKEPIERTVAVKLVKLGMDTKQFIARFESERQALALMEHPCIARVIDGGATETGRPYFVMEYVEGAPITEYCDQHRLSIQERLVLFLQVCAGVQHAHQKGIIHRDLKPSNVMVTEVDGRPVPKIIDFGVAKATTHSLTDKTVRTVLGGWIGTPAYMSPEQAEITDDIDTRTDVYSLGVMLYELLTGQRPFDAETLDSAGFDEMRRVIREVEPPRPSIRALQSSDAKTTAAKTRQTEPRALVKRLRGDLDWIVMKAVEKEKERRYGSPAELAADIERHLSSEPVFASPPSRAYRARKFVRRHQLGVAASVAVVLALLVAVGGTFVGLVRANAEAERANREAEAATQVSDFLVEIFRGSEPGRGNTVTARELLDKGAEGIANDLQDQPLVQARLMHTMGRVYGLLGLNDAAVPLLEEALSTREDLLGSDHVDVATSLWELGGVHWSLRGYGEAESLLRRSLEIRERALDPDHPDLVLSLNNLASVYLEQGKLEDGEPLLKRAVEIREKSPDPEHPATFLLVNLANVYVSQNRYEEAESLLKRAIEIHEKALDPDQDNEEVNLAISLNNFAEFYRDQDKLGEAEPLFKRSFEMLEKYYGPDGHALLANPLHGLGNVYRDQQRFVEAEALYERALTILEKTLEPNHPLLVELRESHAALLRATGRGDEADALLARDNESQP